MLSNAQGSRLSLHVKLFLAGLEDHMEGWSLATCKADAPPAVLLLQTLVPLVCDGDKTLLSWFPFLAPKVSQINRALVLKHICSAALGRNVVRDACPLSIMLMLRAEIHLFSHIFVPTLGSHCHIADKHRFRVPYHHVPEVSAREQLPLSCHSEFQNQLKILALLPVKQVWGLTRGFPLVVLIFCGVLICGLEWGKANDGCLLLFFVQTLFPSV